MRRHSVFRWPLFVFWSLVSMGVATGLVLHPREKALWIMLAVALWGMALYFPFPVAARIRQNITVERSAADVYEFLLRPGNQPLWNPRVGPAQPEDVPAVVGEEWTFMPKRPWPRQGRTTHSFSRLEPPNLVEFTVTGRGLRAVSLYEVEDLGARTRVVIDARVDGLPPTVAWATSALGKVYRSRDLARPKVAIESRALGPAPSIGKT